MIPLAEATGRCEIRPLSTVFRIVTDDAGRVREVLYFDADGREQRQRARAVVLSANGAESARLLLLSESSRFPQGLANSSGLVGKYLMFNGNGQVSGVFPEPLNEYKGALVTRLVTDPFYASDPARGFYGGGALDGRFGPGPLIYALGGLPDGSPRWGPEFKAMLADYCTAPITLDGVTLRFDEETVLRALGKYGRSLAHTLTITTEIRRQSGGKPFDLEMSVDETDTPTSAEEHYFIANELLKRGMPVVSLAPRFVGKFQKGVDYMGDLTEFEAELAKHAAIMHHFNAYKLSVHTGSDKFSIYGIINQYANGRVHVKTAGTSYLEALRVISRTDVPLFRKILDLGHERFAKDRKTYFLDCQPQKVPASSQLTDADLPGLLDDFDARQLLHVTFGSALDEYGAELKTDLTSDEAAYEAVLVAHFGRHLRPFCR